MKASDIITYRKQNGLTQADLADLLGVSKNTVYNYENGSVIPESKIPILEKLINNPNIEHAPVGKTPKRPPDVSKKIPVHDVDFMAGNNVAMFEDAQQETPAYYMDIPQFNGCEGFRAYSDSMKPKIKSGTILFGQKITNWFEHLEFGQIYGIVCNDGRRYLKYIKKSITSPDEYFLLVSENEFYDPFEIPKKDIKNIWLIHGWLNKNT